MYENVGLIDLLKIQTEFESLCLLIRNSRNPANHLISGVFHVIENDLRISKYRQPHYEIFGISYVISSDIY